MKTKAIRVTALWFVGLCVCAIPSCKKEQPAQPNVSSETKAAAEKAAADKAAADKAAADKAAADQAAATRAAERIAAEEAAATKAATEKAAAAKEAALKKAEAAALPADLMVMKSEIDGAVSQIDLTLAKLELLSSSKGDLGKPSEDAIAAIASLDVETQAVKKRAEEMRNRGAAYFDAWEKQLAAMSTPEVVAIATQRKAELAAKYTDVLTSMQESRAAFDPFWADIQAIRKVVEDGVTPETLAHLAPQVKAAKDKSTTLKERVAATSAKLDDVGAIYANR